MAFAIYCIVANDEMARKVLDSLPEHGISDSEVSLVWRQSSPGLQSRYRQMPLVGNAWSARAGVLASWPGLTSVTVRDLGRLFAAGPIREAFDGAATGELMRLAPALAWAGIPDYESRYFAGMVYLGGILILTKGRNLVELESMETQWTKSGAREISFLITEPTDSTQFA